MLKTYKKHICECKEKMDSIIPSLDIGDSGVAGRERHVAGVYIAHKDIDNWERA